MSTGLQKITSRKTRGGCPKKIQTDFQSQFKHCAVAGFVFLTLTSSKSLGSTCVVISPCKSHAFPTICVGACVERWLLSKWEARKSAAEPSQSEFSLILWDSSPCQNQTLGPNFLEGRIDILEAQTRERNSTLQYAALQRPQGS